MIEKIKEWFKTVPYKISFHLFWVAFVAIAVGSCFANLVNYASEGDWGYATFYVAMLALNSVLLYVWVKSLRRTINAVIFTAYKLGLDGVDYRTAFKKDDTV